MPGNLFLMNVRLNVYCILFILGLQFHLCAHQAQVLAPIGPYTGSPAGARILKVNHSGNISVVADNLPSSQTNPLQGSLVAGVGDISFIGNTLYGVLSGAGCSHGVPSVPNGIIKVYPNKKWDLIANLSEFQMNHPVMNPFPPDFEPDGTWYSTVNKFSGLVFYIGP